ncbi:acetyl-CoA synthetase [Nematocida ausubeli]|nr:acetyl-CoA synthetase [Nematocida ausubeli]KAI5137419.1 acetyl-CoA synthetase [Nematocida ausubeli]KAI5149965.1 acetyl-CoA synthetase [Nematocida ausubeli]KAI5163571.1 acetyl-CoA synthetase [Nematocida ausubeli]
MKKVYTHGKQLRENYGTEYRRSIENKEEFFGEQARILLNFSKDFSKTYTVDSASSRIKWFEDGEINACYNAVDRHAISTPNKTAIVYEDDSERVTEMSYQELLQEVLIFSKYLQSKDVKKGDTVCIYMPMEPKALIASLACARLGVSHTVVFGGFSAESLALRMEDSDAVWLITSDHTFRGGKRIDYLGNVASALEILKSGESPSCLRGMLICNKESIPSEVLSKTKGHLEIIDLLSDLPKETLSIEDVPCVSVPSEHTLFHLYTSGSTGRPKGLSHSTAGYLLYAALTTLICFDIKEDDRFFCTAELGWITGHSYVMYGPLTLGITTVVFGGVPTFPDPLRLFRSVERMQATHLYTAPTVIRLLQKSLPTCLVRPYDINESQDNLTPAVDHVPNSPISSRSIFTHGVTDTFDRSRYYKEYNASEVALDKIDLSSLRVLGSVGEPINKGAYVWFSMYFGNGVLPVIDTYWQTEAGGVMLCPLISVTEYKPESASFPFFGMQPVVMKKTTEVEDPSSHKVEEVVGQTGILLFKDFWPGIARTIVKNHERYCSAYLQYPGYFYTGDEVLKDGNGYYWIRGRIDDVINVAGHRLSTAEIESAVCSVQGVAEAAALGEEDEVTGQGVTIFIVKSSDVPEAELFAQIKAVLRKRIGSVVNPKRLLSCPELPKTSTGKMMRRVLRKILEGQEVGDVSTCINPDSITFAKASIAK